MSNSGHKRAAAIYESDMDLLLLIFLYWLTCGVCWFSSEIWLAAPIPSFYERVCDFELYQFWRGSGIFLEMVLMSLGVCVRGYIKRFWRIWETKLRLRQLNYKSIKKKQRGNGLGVGLTRSVWFLLYLHMGWIVCRLLGIFHLLVLIIKIQFILCLSLYWIPTNWRAS